jgi:hypothetical protein
MVAMTPERIEQLYALLKRANFSPQLFPDEEVEALRDLALKGLHARDLECSLDRKEALLLHWVRLLRSERPTTITSALIAEIERELEGK